MYGVKFLLVTTVLLIGATCRADDRAATIETLLKELRQLKQTQHAESRQSTDEFRRTQRLIDLRKKEITSGAEKVKSAEREVAELKKRLVAEQAQAKIVQARQTQLSKAMAQAAITLSAQAKANDFLLSPITKKRLATILADTMPNRVAKRCAGLLSILLDSSAEIARPRLINRTISVNEQSIHVEAIHFGGLFALWRTVDGKRCGYGRIDETQTTYSDLPTMEQAGINQAFRIMRNEEPATVLVLPVPSTEGTP